MTQPSTCPGSLVANVFFTDGLLLCGAPATTPWHYDAVEERPSTSLATGATSPSRWQGSLSREAVSPTSCGWSPNYDHRPLHPQRKAFDCHALDAIRGKGASR